MSRGIERALDAASRSWGQAQWRSSHAPSLGGSAQTGGEAREVEGPQAREPIARLAADVARGQVEFLICWTEWALIPVTAWLSVCKNL
jgi:hypothetical protein